MYTGYMVHVVTGVCKTHLMTTPALPV